MRCIACNNDMSDADLRRVNRHTEEPEEMCGTCIGVVVETLRDVDGIIPEPHYKSFGSLGLFDECGIEYEEQMGESSE